MTSYELKSQNKQTNDFFFNLFQEASKPSEASKTEYTTACNKLKNKVQGKEYLLEIQRTCKLVHLMEFF